MMKKIVASAGAPAAIGAYSQAVCAGNLLFISGQIPIDPESGKMAEGIVNQTRQSLQNIEAILREASCGMENVVDVLVMMKDLGMFAEMNVVYGEFFSKPYPARAAFGVAALPLGALVEIKASAILN